MKTAELKADLYKLIDNTENLSILETISILLKAQFKNKINRQADFWDTLPKSVKIEIEEAVIEADNGKLFSHKEVQKEMKEKYNIEL